MALILNIETSTRVCSVSLHLNRQIIGLKELFTDKSHSSLLPVLIRDLVSECGYEMRNLNAVAVSKGPGSYTGLRIGTSAAKGICYALDIPLIGVNTLKAMAFGMIKYNVQNALLCPMLDARRMEVYLMITDNCQKIHEDTKAMVVDEDSFSERLSEHEVFFFGPGADKIENLFVHKKNAFFIRGVFPSAAEIGYLSQEKFMNGDFDNTAYFEPFYLKEFISKKPNPKF